MTSISTVLAHAEHGIRSFKPVKEAVARLHNEGSTFYPQCLETCLVGMYSIPLFAIYTEADTEAYAEVIYEFGTITGEARKQFLDDLKSIRTINDLAKACERAEVVLKRRSGLGLRLLTALHVRT